MHHLGGNAGECAWGKAGRLPPPDELGRYLYKAENRLLVVLLRSGPRKPNLCLFTPQHGRPYPTFRLVNTPLGSLPQELLGISASELRLNTSVTRVVGSAKDGYSLFGGDGGAEDKLGTFDAVVIAAPIGLAGITLDMRGEVRTASRFSFHGSVA